MVAKLRDRHRHDVLARYRYEPPPDYTTLRFDYAAIDEAHRRLVQDAALDIRTRQRRAAEDLIAIGQQLREVKAVLSHGHFLDWVEKEFGYSRQGTSELMLISQRFAPNVRSIGHLNESSLRLLAGPSVPDAVIDAVISAGAEMDRPMSVREVKAIKAAYMPAKRIDTPPQSVSIEVEYSVMAAEPDPARTITITVDRALAEKLHAAILVSALRYHLRTAEQEQLKQVLKEALGHDA